MRSHVSAFSLVEVTIALGIISFCVISVFALLPIGMNSIKQGRDNRNAVELINQVTSELTRRRTPSPTNEFHLSGTFSNVIWKVGGPVVTETATVAADGRYDASGDGEKMKAWVEIAPPSTSWSVGMARVSVAWPELASRNTNAPNNWTNAKGSVDAVIYFNP